MQNIRGGHYESGPALAFTDGSRPRSPNSPGSERRTKHQLAPRASWFSSTQHRTVDYVLWSTIRTVQGPSAVTCRRNVPDPIGYVEPPPAPWWSTTVPKSRSPVMANLKVVPVVA